MAPLSPAPLLVGLRRGTAAPGRGCLAPTETPTPAASCLALPARGSPFLLHPVLAARSTTLLPALPAHPAGDCARVPNHGTAGTRSPQHSTGQTARAAPGPSPHKPEQGCTEPGSALCPIVPAAACAQPHAGQAGCSSQDPPGLLPSPRQRLGIAQNQPGAPRPPAGPWSRGSYRPQRPACPAVLRTLTQRQPGRQH